MKILKNNIALICLVIVIGTAPLMLVKNSEFGGADGKAEELITEINPGYEPWAESLITPPGGETESLLFALQAALGAGVVCYVLGYFRGRAKNADR